MCPHLISSALLKGSNSGHMLGHREGGEREREERGREGGKESEVKEEGGKMEK